MRGNWLGGALLAVVLGTASCSGKSSSDGGSAGSGPITSPSGFCDGTFGAVTDYLDSHCSAADKQSDSYLFFFAFLSAGVQECASSLKNSIDNGRAEIDATAAGACVDGYQKALDAAANLENLDTTIAQQIKDACANAITGKVAIGGGCSQSVDCPSGASCVGYTSSKLGTCQTPAIGEACGRGESTSGELTVTLSFGDHPECANAYCDSVYENSEFVHKCVALKAAGESCSDSDECQSSLRCQTGKCSTEGPAAVGGACQVSDDCADKLYCDNSTHVCAAKKQSGETCDPGLLGGNECLGTCSAAEGAETGTCVAFCGQG